jgi:hypothetical protein
MLQVYQEAVSIARFTRALVIRRGATSQLMKEGDEFVLTEISNGRFALLMSCVIIPRIIMLFMLWYFGSM